MRRVNSPDRVQAAVRALLGIAAAALAGTAPLEVYAQTSDEAAAPQSSLGETSLQEITVTATRVSEKLSRVAASVTAFDQVKLDQEGVRSVDDVARLTPGVMFTSTGFAGTTNISIRGIGSTVGASTTGIYIDDTPIQVRSLGFAATNPYPEVFDLARVEVLRGPQGTLFGAGSEGGTVRFITPQPSVSQYSGYARAEFSQIEHGGPGGEAGAAIGGPIIDGTLGFRASVWAQRTGGFIDRVSATDLHTLDSNTNWRNAYVGRFALAYVPYDWLTVTPSVYYQQTYQNASLQYYQRISNPDDGVFRAADALGSPAHERFTLPTLNIQADLGQFTLTSVTSEFIRRGDPDVQDYSHSFPILLLGPHIFDNSLYVPGVPNYTLLSNFYNKQDNFTQEIRLQTSNKEARLTGIVGVFLQRARQQDVQLFDDPLLPTLVSTYFGGASVAQVLGAPMLSPTRSYESNDISHDNQEAVFGEVTYRVTDALKATIGLRYARTHFSYNNFQAGPWAGTTGLSVSGKQDENPVTPKFGVSYQLDDADMVYATISKGYRVGGVNKPIPVTSDACRGDLAAFGLTPALGPYNSDHVWSYEIGAKDSLLGGNLQLYSSVYHIKWSNIQQSVTLTDCGFNFIGNVGTAVSQGGDVQFQAALGRYFNLSGSVAYNNAHYTGTVLGALDPRVGTRGIVVNDGDGLPNVPWMVTLSPEYHQEFFGKEVYGRLTYTHSTHNTRHTPDQDPATLSYDPTVITQPEINLLNARAGVRFSGLDLSLFVNNLTDSHPLMTRTNYVRGGSLFYDTTLVPRSIGLTATYGF